MAWEEIMNLPTASHLRETEFVWENFEPIVFFPYIHDFTYEIKKAFANIHFWPKKLPSTKDKLTSYRELKAILNHYGPPNLIPFTEILFDKNRT